MSGASIKGKAISSVVWKFSERIIAKFVTLIVSIVLARILLPEDYSVVSIVTIFFAFANIIISGGFNTALIQKKEADIVDFSSVLYFSLGLAAISYIILFITAPFIANGYHQPILAPIFRVMGLILPVSALKSIVCAYISVHLDFKKFFFATIIGTVISAVVGIAMAKHGFGAWALVAQQMTNTVIDTIILCVITRIKFVPKLSLKKLRTLFSYGWKIFLSSLIATAYNEANPIVISLRFQASDLSFYTKGRSFPGLISTTTTETLAAVLFPVLARYQDNKESLLKYTRLFMRISSYVAFPLMLGFFAISDSFIYLMLTEKWMPAVPYVKIFCLTSMFDMIHVGNCETIKAMGRSDVYLKMEIIKKTGYFITILLFVFLATSPIQLACSFIICTLIAIIVNSIPNVKMLNYRFCMQIEDLLPNLLISVLMCVVVSLVGMLDINKVVLLLLQLVVAIVVYILSSIITHNSSYIYLRNLVKGYASSFFCK